ncbi:PP2C family protein-serine/threonine phosphatase, partial [Bacteroidota bacterium]
NYAMINSNQYRYRLIGQDNSWSDWEEENIVSFSNLGPGRYVFQAQTSNIFSQEGLVTEYIFMVQRPWYLSILMLIIYLLALAMLVRYIVKLNSRRLIRQKEKLEVLVDDRTLEIRNQTEEILSQRDEIEAQRDALMEQKDKIDMQNIALTDSIKYARRIQDAVLPPADVMRYLLPKHFVFYRPRDIVSGDFFWVDKKENQVMLALGDCTGHGVPGAFMSMLGISLLTEISNKINPFTTDEIMNELREQVILSLKQTGEADEAKDGMDMALVNLDTKTLELQFTGAQLNLYLFQNGELEEIKGDRMPVGIHSRAGKKFQAQKIQLQKGDTFYMTSDGYPDQFGGDLEKKFGYKRLRTLLTEMQDMIMHDQKRAMSEEFDRWKGNIEQIDDVLVIGIKV